MDPTGQNLPLVYRPPRPGDTLDMLSGVFKGAKGRHSPQFPGSFAQAGDAAAACDSLQPPEICLDIAGMIAASYPEKYRNIIITDTELHSFKSKPRTKKKK
ncbi:hypothetical protein UY3_08162 [Chelonia mydas]|uniref:Uncharacterized protein n=1 Tax=Chelonia mydas TaxID=8469 RepID=M7B9E0_CHEMY|nr:hypothetical protein UY3_08162 [Chelonia mydas]